MRQPNQIRLNWIWLSAHCTGAYGITIHKYFRHKSRFSMNIKRRSLLLQPMNIGMRGKLSLNHWLQSDYSLLLTMKETWILWNEANLTASKNKPGVKTESSYQPCFALFAISATKSRSIELWDSIDWESTRIQSSGEILHRNHMSKSIPIMTPIAVA